MPKIYVICHEICLVTIPQKMIRARSIYQKLLAVNIVEVKKSGVTGDNIWKGKKEY